MTLRYCASKRARNIAALIVVLRLKSTAIFSFEWVVTRLYRDIIYSKRIVSLLILLNCSS